MAKSDTCTLEDKVCEGKAKVGNGWEIQWTMTPAEGQKAVLNFFDASGRRFVIQHLAEKQWLDIEVHSADAVQIYGHAFDYVEVDAFGDEAINVTKETNLGKYFVTEQIEYYPQPSHVSGDDTTDEYYYSAEDYYYGMERNAKKGFGMLANYTVNFTRKDKTELEFQGEELDATITVVKRNVIIDFRNETLYFNCMTGREMENREFGSDRRQLQTHSE